MWFGVIGDYMKQPNFSPVFASLYTGLCAIARSNGYALTVHGTLNLDFDLVAIPWTEQAVEPIELIEAMAERLNLYGGQMFEGVHSKKPEIKPHGRLAWLLMFGSGANIDISVMPRLVTL